VSFIPECNICGKEEENLLKIKVEDAIVEVCKDCSSFGQIVYEKSKKVEEDKKEQEDEYEIAENYGEIIRKAREKMNFSRKDFALKLKIKENILKRIENEELLPEKDVAKKIEKELGIKILEKIDGKLPRKEYKESSLTIGDVAKID